jgi:DNA-binding CsgD family transcriptional regulator
MKGPREASAARTPDGIEPLVGYRMWQYARRSGRGRLHSLNCSGRRWRFDSCPWEGAESSWVVASCTLHDRPSHVAPAENCSCGFYAMKTLEGLFWEMLNWMSAEDGKVLGRIELAGKIIEHEHGYRAEKARIAELIPVQGTERDVMRLATRLGLPTGQPVAPRVFEPTPSSEVAMRVLIVDEVRLRAVNPPPASLSPREVEILQRVVQGYSTQHVAASLSLAQGTVKAHLERIYEKLAATNQSDALTWWFGTSSN